MIRETATGIELLVRVIPRAKRTEASGERDGHLLIRLSAPPVDGAANEALIEFLSRQLGCPKRAIRLTSGDTNRTKRLTIDGVSASTAARALSAT
ncbi:MAG: DUF167 domain-containing protein [Acidobacteriaceae bacterium]|jgi:uncharacterized protein (TIGR00251 family)|nr:DUF167 domain-containing protein [Acidobacteriaceae bacterium]